MHTLADKIDADYVQIVSRYMPDPWQLLYRYIEVLHGEQPVLEWIQCTLDRRVTLDELTQLERLLRAQLNKQKIFTSCGWFFDDFDRIEPRIVITAAAHAVWWLKQAGGSDLIQEGSQLLAQVRSWRTSLRGDVPFLRQIDRLRYEQLPLPFTEFELTLVGGPIS